MGWERSIIYIWVQRDVPRDVQIRPEIWGKVDSFCCRTLLSVVSGLQVQVSDWDVVEAGEK